MGSAAVNKTWSKWREHFIEAHKLREASGISATHAGYHGATNAHANNDRNVNESLAQSTTFQVNFSTT